MIRLLGATGLRLVAAACGAVAARLDPRVLEDDLEEVPAVDELDEIPFEGVITSEATAMMQDPAPNPPAPIALVPPPPVVLRGSLADRIARAGRRG